MEKTIASIGSKRNILVFKLNEFKERRTFDIRKYYYDSKSNEFLPTKKGITIAKNLFIVMHTIINEHEDEIREWLEGSSILSMQLLNQQKQQAAAAENAKYSPTTISVKNEPWKSPNFFEQENEGGKSVLIYNEQHPFKKAMDELGEELAHHKVPEEVINNAKRLIDSILVSFSRAKDLFNQEETIHAETFFTTLSFNWGNLLKSYFKNGGKE